MANIKKRKAKSGEYRYDVRWRIEGEQHQRTFRRSRDAETFKRQVEYEELSGLAINPTRAEITLAEYADAWLPARRKGDGRPLAPRTRELYLDLLDRFLKPALGDKQLGALRVEHIRTWHTELAESAGPLQAAKAYRLLRVILNTAVEDQRIGSNPCKIRGAGVERSPERPFVDAEIVLRLAAAIEERYCALVLLAGFGGLRLGELIGLRRRDILLDRHQVRVDVQVVELKHGERVTTAPKTDAGRRFVALPDAVMSTLAAHLEKYVAAAPDAPVFTGPLSETLRRATFYTAWHKALTTTGQQGLHLHDLRHAAGTLAAQQGATIRELMARLGHASPAAAHRYQHAAERRDAVIADALSTVIDAARRMEGAPSIPLLDAARNQRGDAGGMRPAGDVVHNPDDRPETGPDQAVPLRASDGNRTRVLSLGS